MPHLNKPNDMNNESKAASTGHFPSRVMAILNDEEVQKTMHWLPDGKAFMISKPSEFTETVLKKHFKGVQLLSFVKSLSRECDCANLAPG